MEQLILEAEKLSFVFTDVKSVGNETLIEFKFYAQGKEIFSGFEKKLYI